MKFVKLPFLNGASESEECTIQLEHIEEVRPHEAVTVGAESGIACCEVFFFSGRSIVVLLQYSTVRERMETVSGIIDEFAEPA